jgi:hypothetical protein
LTRTGLNYFPVCVDSYAIGHDNPSWRPYACSPGYIVGGPLYDASCQMRHDYPVGPGMDPTDCRAFSGDCQTCNTKVDGSIPGELKCRFCSRAPGTAQNLSPGCYAWNNTIGPPCVGNTAGAKQTANLVYDAQCKMTPPPTRAPTPIPTPMPVRTNTRHMQTHN